MVYGGGGVPVRATMTIKATLQQCLDAGPHYFVLEITDVKSTRANYDPAAAVPHLNTSTE